VDISNPPTRLKQDTIPHFGFHQVSVHTLDESSARTYLRIVYTILQGLVQGVSILGPVGLEPTTYRLKAECSTIVLWTLQNLMSYVVQVYHASQRGRAPAMKLEV
jgi:hypothetical protein